MRRFGIAIIILLLVLCGGYTAFWFVIADRMADSVGQWADAMRLQDVDASWQSLNVSGYPLAFRIELREARLRETGNRRALELRCPLLSAQTVPWSFRTWQLVAPNGLSALAEPDGKPVATLTARTAEGRIVRTGEHGIDARLVLESPALDAGAHVAARTAALTLSVPENPPRQHTEPLFGLGFDIRELNLPAVPARLGNSIDELTLAVRVLGAIPGAPPRQAAEAWRDAGGTVELDRLALRWGSLGITGSGTLALDRELQPEGAFSGTIQGYDELMSALVDSRILRAGDAQLARLALGMLAKPGTDGKPQIATSFRLQNGEMFLGPAKLGKLPRLTWE